MRAQLQKTWVTITGVHTSTRQIEGELRAGGKIILGLNEISPTFRWPIQGEVWSVTRDAMDGVTWRLCDRVHYNAITDEEPIETFDPGQMRLDAEEVFDRRGRRLLHRGQGLDWQGAWAAQAYEAGAVVRHTNALWIALNDASSTDVPGIGSQWDLMLQGVAP